MNVLVFPFILSPSQQLVLPLMDMKQLEMLLAPVLLWVDLFLRI